jgi:hypothetical protein
MRKHSASLGDTVTSHTASHNVPALPQDLTALGPSDPEVDIDILRCIPHQFCVVDESTANWLVRRIVASREYRERVKGWAEKEQRRGEREEQTLLFLFGRQLEAWVRSEVVKFQGRRKSITLPAGIAGFRRSPSKLVIDDDAVVMAWAREHCPHAIAVTEKLVKAIIDRYVNETGHAPDSGIHIEPEAERFFIR